MHTRRHALATLAALAGGALVRPAAAARPAGSPAPTVEVWKSPSCGCCKDWVTHLERNGFAVTVHDTGNSAARARLAMPARHGSCHTAQAGRYAIEGHVPAREIRRLLAERPDAVGLAVPGMPVGSPGMEQGSERDPFDVLLVRADGSATVYQRYR